MEESVKVYHARQTSEGKIKYKESRMRKEKFNFNGNFNGPRE